MAREVYLRICAARRGKDVALPDGEICRDLYLTAIRGLAKFNDQEVLETLIEILETDRDNIALINRAHISLKAITGQGLPPSPAEWRKLIEPPD